MSNNVLIKQNLNGIVKKSNSKPNRYRCNTCQTKVAALKIAGGRQGYQRIPGDNAMQTAAARGQPWPESRRRRNPSRDWSCLVPSTEKKPCRVAQILTQRETSNEGAKYKFK